MQHVDFDPSVLAQTNRVSVMSIKLQFTTRVLIPELKLRGVSLHDVSVLTFEGKRNKLREYLLEEKHISQIILALELGNNANDSAMILVHQAVPCVLHMNMRITEKFTKLILQEGLNNNLSDRDAFIVNIEKFMNQSVFGTGIERVGQWKFPVAIEDKGAVGEFTFKGNEAETVLTQSDELVDLCCCGDKKIIWKSLLNKHKEGDQIVRKKTNYTDDDLDNFRDVSYEFYLKCVTHIGLTGITNYLHMWGCGHIHYCMKKYRNLHRYSQQGWEGLNSKITSVFFQHANKGGGKVTANHARSFLIAVARFLVRDIMWRSGEGEKFFLEKDSNDDLNNS